MDEQIRLNRIDDVLADLEYPVTPPSVVDACGEVVVRLAEGTVSVGEVIEASSADQFASSEDLELEFMSLLPRDAVGEPYQSDGDA
jgi:hypothetical protein